MSRVAAWLDDTRRTYFSNATSVRDFRVQMRGSKSALLFAMYLFVLVAVTLTTYGTVTNNYGNSIVNAQLQLKVLYSTVMGLLGGVVALVTPALTATTIVTERQRHSFDLIFSAPVRPRYYLVGKLIASFRYTWMLLILSLPVTATCVMLGGASWSDVLVTYIALSFQGLIYTSFALLMSTVAPRPVSAIVYSYSAAGFFLLVTSALSANAAISSLTTASLEAPFYSTLNPFALGLSINTYSLIYGVGVPNWIFTVLIALILCRLSLLAAGAQLSPKPQKEISALRRQCLLWTTVIFSYTGYQTATTTSYSPIQSAFLGTLPILLACPFIICFGKGAERRYRLNGTFQLKHTLDGTAAGAGPFLLAVAGVTVLAPMLGAMIQGSSIRPADVTIGVYVLSFWVFWWAAGRFISAYNKQIKIARLASFGLIVVLLAIPVPFLSVLDAARGYGGGWPFIYYHPLSPVFTDLSTATITAAAFAALFFALGAAMTVLAERRIRTLYTPEELEIERVLATT